MQKPKLADESGVQHDLQVLQDSWMGFIELSRLLFGPDEPMYNINEMAKSCKFYQPAQEIAKLLKISWDKMTHEESNRIMLALLEDYYKSMADVDENKRVAIEITLKVTK